MIAAIVLTAGKSERMGRPKALLQFKGRTFLERILGTIRTAGIDTIAVVAGHHFAEIEMAFPKIPLIFNSEYPKGMSTSVQAGIRSLPPAAIAAGVFLVDHPLIDSGTIVSLLQEVKRDRIVLPVSQGRRGHPVFIGAALFPEVLALDSDKGLNSVVRLDPVRVREVEVADPGVLRDIDTPEQFENLLRETQ